MIFTCLNERVFGYQNTFVLVSWVWSRMVDIVIQVYGYRYTVLNILLRYCISLLLCNRVTIAAVSYYMIVRIVQLGVACSPEPL
jgi:hypothetical protein